VIKGGWAFDPDELAARRGKSSQEHRDD
jgi:hypothetical protein